MRKCSGNCTYEWGPDAIFDIQCPTCGHMVEFFKDEIRRNCPYCKNPVHNNSGDYGCGQWCSSATPDTRGFCPKFIRSRNRSHGHKWA